MVAAVALPTEVANNFLRVAVNRRKVAGLFGSDIVDTGSDTDSAEVADIAG